MALFYICQVSQSTSNLNENHRFTIGRAIKFEELCDREREQRHHFVVDRLDLHIAVRVCKALDRSNSVVE